MLIRKISNVIAVIMFIVFWVSVAALDSISWVPIIMALVSLGYIAIFAKVRGWLV